jgi:plastocyanin
LKRSLVGGAVVAATLLSVVPGAQAVRVKIDGHLYGVMPAGSSTGPVASSPDSATATKSPLAAPFVSAPSGWNVQYEGGPVLHTVKPYVIFWDPSGVTSPTSTTSKQIIDQYLTDVAATSSAPQDTYGVGRQYYDSAGIAGAGVTFSAGTQAFTDTDSYPLPDTSNCPTDARFASCLTDAQLVTELNAFITSHGLPNDGPETAAGFPSYTEFPSQAPVYFIVVPESINTCMDAGHCESSSPGYCAYHSAYLDNNSNIVLYANVPFSVFALGSKGCQADAYPSVYQSPNSDQADNIVDNLSHELNETISDPVIDAWVNAGGDGNELADQCQAYPRSAPSVSDPTQGLSTNAYAPTLGGSSSGGTLYDQLINGDRYYTQSLWSNGQVNCELSPTPATLTPTFAAGTAVPGLVTSIDATGTTSSAGIASATWNWGDGTTSFYPGSLTKVTHTYTAAGDYKATLTVVDNNGNLASVTNQIAVGHNPNVVIGGQPAPVYAGNPVGFSGTSSSDPNAGATLTGYSWNFGDGASGSGATVTHTFSAPGTYTVTLTASDSYELSAAQAETLHVLAPTITKIQLKQQGGTAYLLVTVPQAGSLSYGRRTTRLSGAQTVKLKLVLTKQQQRELNAGHKVVITIRLVYSPSHGSRVTKSERLTLKPHRRR